MLEDFKASFRRPNNAHVQLIMINVVVFLCIAVISVTTKIANMEWIAEIVIKQFTIPPDFYEFLRIPWTLITYAFMHSLNDIFHILFNMLVLYWFGKLFVEYLGNNKVISLYVLGALSGSIAYLVVFNTIPYFIDRSGFSGMVGASASVYAIVTATATLLPEYTFYLFFFGPVRIKYIAFFYIALSFLGMVGSNAGGNIAHLGGALMGYLYIKQLQAGSDWGAWVMDTVNWIKSWARSNPPTRKTTYRNPSSHKNDKSTKKRIVEVSQEEIDAILDKISEKGYESLTSDEKKKLFNASKKT